MLAFVKESGKRKKTNANNMREQCSVLSENTVALQLMFVKRSTKQNHNVSVDRVETGNENEEADSTTNVGLTMLTAITN